MPQSRSYSPKHAENDSIFHPRVNYLTITPQAVLQLELFKNENRRGAHAHLMRMVVRRLTHEQMRDVVLSTHWRGRTQKYDRRSGIMVAKDLIDFKSRSDYVESGFHEVN
jgi:hypothetical protein